MEQVVAFAGQGDFELIDITGGAPELHPDLGEFIRALAPLAPRTLLRSNLTALYRKGEPLMNLLKESNIGIVASFPSLNGIQTESIRGKGCFEISIEALKQLNLLGYGKEGELNLVVNPAGAFLPPPQEQLEKRFREVLEQNQLNALEFERGSTSTSVTAADKLGVSVAQIAKSMLFLGKDRRYYMVVCSGNRRISSSKLKKTLGVKARMATAEETLEATGFEPGGVCPFGITGIEVYVDQSLQPFDTIYPAAGTDSSGVPMTFDQLLEITGAQVCNCTVPMVKKE
jgi:prolyl-tRNA editing enzyme YbaK/EbsC (Cys-tRNA(Pro) deacylase)